MSGSHPERWWRTLSSCSRNKYVTLNLNSLCPYGILYVTWHLLILSGYKRPLNLKLTEWTTWFCLHIWHRRGTVFTFPPTTPDSKNNYRSGLLLFLNWTKNIKVNNNPPDWGYLIQTLAYITDHTSQHFVTDAFISPYLTQRGLAVCLWAEYGQIYSDYEEILSEVVQISDCSSKMTYSQ